VPTVGRGRYTLRVIVTCLPLLCSKQGRGRYTLRVIGSGGEEFRAIVAKPARGYPYPKGVRGKG